MAKALIAPSCGQGFLLAGEKNIHPGRVKIRVWPFIRGTVPDPGKIV